MLPRDLLQIAGSETHDLIERAIAALTCLGSDHAPWTLTGRIVEVEVLLSAILGARCPDAAQLYGWAFRKAKVAIAITSALLLSANGVLSPPLATYDDDLPPTTWCRDIPTFGLDQYTRAGLRALNAYIGRDPEWRAFSDPLKLSLPDQRRTLGELLFRVDGAAVTQRAYWDIGWTLREQAKTVGCCVPVEAAGEGLALVRERLPVIEEYRAEALSKAMCN